MNMNKSDTDKIFREHMDKYNKNKEFYEHYVQVAPKVLMVITWRQSWNYGMYDLEQFKSD